MKDKIFVDSNVILYCFAQERTQKERAKDLIRERPLISIQVVNEVINVLLRKFNVTTEEIKKIFNFLTKKSDISLLNCKTIDLALLIKEKYKYNYYDCLIIASALENDCTILYTEDMQDGQIIEGRLKIVNPFK